MKLLINTVVFFTTFIALNALPTTYGYLEIHYGNWQMRGCVTGATPTTCSISFENGQAGPSQIPTCLVEADLKTELKIKDDLYIATPASDTNDAFPKGSKLKRITYTKTQRELTDEDMKVSLSQQN